MRSSVIVKQQSVGFIGPDLERHGSRLGCLPGGQHLVRSNKKGGGKKREELHQMTRSAEAIQKCVEQQRSAHTTWSHLVNEAELYAYK